LTRRELAPYPNCPVAGLWRDKLKEHGQWIDKPAPVARSTTWHAAATKTSILKRAGGAG
jgi:mannose/cellobiose epimerase-like protein (N-acyl-D-glucosamine 2-epimerase family)